MPAEVVGVKDVLAGLKFIDKDLQDRIRTAIDPLMRNVAAKARSFVPGNAEVLSGWTKEPNPEINYRPFPKYDAGTVKAGIDITQAITARSKMDLELVTMFTT